MIVRLRLSAPAKSLLSIPVLRLLIGPVAFFTCSTHHLTGQSRPDGADLAVSRDPAGRVEKQQPISGPYRPSNHRAPHTVLSNFIQPTQPPRRPNDIKHSPSSPYLTATGTPVCKERPSFESEKPGQSHVMGQISPPNSQAAICGDGRELGP